MGRYALTSSSCHYRIQLLTQTAAADRKLLLGILKMQNVSVDNEVMAKYMSTDDQVCTISAIQNRVKKLKAIAKSETVGG